MSGWSNTPEKPDDLTLHVTTDSFYCRPTTTLLNVTQHCSPSPSIPVYIFPYMFWFLLMSVTKVMVVFVSLYFDRLVCHMWNLLNYFLCARTFTVFRSYFLYKLRILCVLDGIWF